MALLTPSSPELRLALAREDITVVACFCAAWCDTCSEYRPKFEALAATQHPEAVFVWIDIEEHPELLGDEDVENFPTIAIERSGQWLFYGVMLPHIHQLERLIQSLTPAPLGARVSTTLPPLREQLLAH